METISLQQTKIETPTLDQFGGSDLCLGRQAGSGNQQGKEIGQVIEF